MLVVRAYHDLAWLAQTWNVRLADIAYLGENDLLRLSIRVFDEELRDCPVEGATEAAPARLRRFSGLLGLRSQDAFAIFRDGDAIIDRLVDPCGRHVRLLAPKFVLMGDLVVDEAERQRFEQMNPSLARGRASICFKSFRWEGRTYGFTSLQARFLQRLHDAGIAGRPWLNGKSLLAEIGSALVKPGDLFRRNPQWRDIVDHDQRGNYRLQPSFMAHPPW
jgi:hypothetical protein